MSTRFDSMGQFTDTVAGDLRDPYPDLALKRRDHPVELSMQMGFDLETRLTATAFRYEDVNTILRDDVTYSSSFIRDLVGVVMGPFALVGMDEPEHKRHRHLVSHTFRSKALAHWEDDLITDVIDGLIDQFEGDGHAELVQQFTFRFPVQVIAEVLGVPRQDHEQFHDCAVAIINVAADPDNGIKASEAMRAYLATHVEARRSEPRTDVISDLVTSEIDGEMLSDEEIFSFLRLLLPAGAETTYRAAGNFLFGLLTHPEQLEALRGRPRADDLSRRGGDPVGDAAAHHRPARHSGRRAGRRRDPRGCERDRPPGLGQSRRDALGQRRGVRHPSHSAAPDRVRGRPAHVPRDAPRPPRDEGRGQPPARSAPEPAPRPRGRRPAHPRGALPVAYLGAGPVRLMPGRDIRIDRERCMGSGNCGFWAPATFDLDDDGIAVVVNPDGDDEAKILHAARSCPTSAIEISVD